jgi:HSP20 family molecular chaperone IbpA
MPGSPVKSVVITPENEARFRKRLDNLRDRIRKRAFELYCRRSSLGADKADWLQAEREICLSPLAGIEDNDNKIRIIAAVPDVDASHLTVDVLPGSIVVEGEAATSPVERYSVFPLCEPIEPAGVKAEFRNGDLTIVAPKANPPK